MTLNELIERAKKVSRKYSSGDIPLWMNGEEVGLVLRDEFMRYVAGLMLCNTLVTVSRYHEYHMDEE